ncbi:MAG: hypothetical protein HY727_06410 [Candidatus Rokubacteria bacterium]|nr:hypothetical protein [Candidatus Rokubacteria bacterium]
MRPRHAALAALALVLVSASPARAYEAEAQAYVKALESICTTGVTPEVKKLYEAYVKAVDLAEYGRGRGSNFGGPKDPEHAHHECVQAPSFL